MSKLSLCLTRFLSWSIRMASRPLSFVTALFVLLMWVIGGFIWGFTDSWLILINTVATINASLMVFIIQNTQFRESKALHLKIDELIIATKEAENALVAIEEKGEAEIENIRKELHEKKLNKRH